MQRQWYFLYHPKTNTFWMCDTDLARIGDLRCRQCNAITEDNCLLFFGPCTSHRQHHLDYSLRNHKRAVGVALTRIVRVHAFDTAPTHPALLRLSAMISQYFTRCRSAVTDCSRALAAQVWSLQAVRSPSGFALPALSRLLRGRSFQILTLRWSHPGPESCHFAPPPCGAL